MRFGFPLRNAKRLQGQHYAPTLPIVNPFAGLDFQQLPNAIHETTAK